MTDQGETMTVPRPAPDEVIIAVCGEDGARAWVMGKQGTLGDAEFLAQVEPLLAGAQQRLREQAGGTAG